MDRSRRRNSPEHDLQCTVMRWSKINEDRLKELKMLHAVPNAGAGASKGQAGKMKAEGAKPGVPDLDLPVARGGWFGLRIEVKIGTNRLADDQIWWHTMLHHEGYCVVICRTFEQITGVIEKYLSFARTPSEGGISVV